MEDKPSSVDVDKILRDCYNFKSKAPVGRKIICIEQRNLEIFGRYAPDDTVTSTEDNSTINETTASIEKDDSENSLENTRELLGRMKEKQRAYFRDEQLLGGSFNIFENKPPRFIADVKAKIGQEYDADETPTTSPKSKDMFDGINFSSKSTTKDNPNASVITPIVAAGSQGRIGEGCSTPKSAIDHTFAPLRHLDLSVVTDVSMQASSQDNSEQKVTETKNGNYETAQKNSEPIKSGESNFAFPKPMRRSARISGSIDAMKIRRISPKPVVSNKKTDSLSSSTQKEVENHSIAALQQTHSSAVNSTFICSDKISSSDLVRPAITDDINSKTFSIINSDVTMEDVEHNSLPCNTTQVISNEEQNTKKESLLPFIEKQSSLLVTEKKGSLPVIEKASVRTKIGASERERREMTRKNQSSLLADLDSDVQSPGRLMFKARPAKKVRQLPSTPSRKPISDRASIDSMEKSITMSYISDQTSVVAGDDSMCDPVSDRGNTPLEVQAKTIKAKLKSNGKNSSESKIKIGGELVSSSEPVRIEPTHEIEFTTPVSNRRSVSRLSRQSANSPFEEVNDNGTPKQLEFMPSFSNQTNDDCSLSQSIGSQSSQKLNKTRTEIIEGVVNRLYKSPNRCNDAQNWSKTTLNNNVKDSLKASTTPNRGGRTTPTREFTPLTANFLRPTVSSAMRSSSYVPAAKTTPVKSMDISKEYVEKNTYYPTLVDGYDDISGDDSFIESTSKTTTNVKSSHNSQNTLAQKFVLSKGDTDVAHADIAVIRNANLSKIRERKDVKKLSVEYDNIASREAMGDISDHVGNYDDDFDHIEMEQNGAHRVSKTPVYKPLLSDSMCTVNTPHINHRNTRAIFFEDNNETKNDMDDINETMFERLSICDSEQANQTVITSCKILRRKPVEIVLKPRELIKPVEDDDAVGLRRSTRTRMKPVRTWLGERPVYALSPSGNRNLVGATGVTINDRTLLKARSLDINIITERQTRHNAHLRKTRERRREAKQRSSESS